MGKDTTAIDKTRAKMRSAGWVYLDARYPGVYIMSGERQYPRQPVDWLVSGNVIMDTFMEFCASEQQAQELRQQFAQD